MENFDSIIIGAGPAGLMGGITCAAGGARTCLLEKNMNPGKKFLLSGSGRCNITHSGAVDDFMRHYGPGGQFIKPAFMNFSNRDLARFFNERGLDTVELDNGKVFPATMRSGDVLNILMRECAGTGMEIRYNEPVLDISRSGTGFEIKTGRRGYQTEKLLLATGGRSYPQTGSTGDGYPLAEKLGHGIEDLQPALAPVIIKNFPFRECSGISVAGSSVTLYRNGKRVRHCRGDVLMTHRGLSGPGILDFSRYILPGDIIGVSLVQCDNPAACEKKILDDIAAAGKKTLKKCIVQNGIPERLVDALFSITGIPGDTKASHADKKTRSLIIKSLLDYRFSVERPGDYNEAMATKGGIPLREINKNTMESRLVQGLFFAGEVIDIDGDTGGYNLQFAFSSGVLAGRSMIKKQLKKRG